MITTVKGTSFMPINQFQYVVQSISFSQCFTSYVFMLILMRNGKDLDFFFFFLSYFQDTVHQQHNSTAFASILTPSTLINRAGVPKMERES